MKEEPKDKVHRPHAKWRDYKARGIYLITIVVRHRDHILGELNNDARNPGVILSETGKGVEKCWEKIKELNAVKGRAISLISHCIMPDHFHGVIFVKEDMDISVGTVINGFKTGCTKEWRRICYGLTNSSTQAYIDTLPLEDRQNYELINHVSINKRPAIYDKLPRLLQPLFEDNYDDTILYKRGQLQNMIDYVRDNPRRAIYRTVYRNLYQKILRIKIAGRMYGAFGNLFLLKWPHKVPVWFHRFEQSPENLRLPMAHRKRFEDTEEFAREREKLLEMASEGTVIVTAGISKGEQAIKKDCIENGLKIIHLQKEPITRFWKPEKSRFDYCATGNMLILAPWGIAEMGDFNGVESSSNYAQFHNINTLAADIANFYGKALILGQQ